jgi:D-3-phosphoglycerate dehydrogenase
VPITKETRGMIGKGEIARMKDGAYLINTARSGIVDEGALAEALREGKLHGAAIDVPRSPDDAPAFLEMFSGLENVFITPHISSATREAMERSRDQISMYVRRYLDGERPLFVVNGL